MSLETRRLTLLPCSAEHLLTLIDRPEHFAGSSPRLGGPATDSLPRTDIVPDAQLLDGHRSLRAPNGHDQLQKEHRAAWRSLDVVAHPAAMALELAVVRTASAYLRVTQ